MTSGIFSLAHRLNTIIGMNATTRIARTIVLVGAIAAAAQPTPSRQEFTRRLVAAAIERTHHTVRYVSE